MQHKKNNPGKRQVVFHTEHVKGETVETMENVLFTEITIQHLRCMPMCHFLPVLQVITEQQNMQNIVIFDNGGIQYKGDGLKNALNMVEKSVMCN